MSNDSINGQNGQGNTDSLMPKVFPKNGHAFADSRDVAAYFRKSHRNVLRVIDGLIKTEPKLALLNFEQGSYTAPETGEKQHRRFDMDRDGFALLAMGFTGTEALKFKLKYIETFNMMEAQLHKAPPEMPKLEEPDDLKLKKVNTVCRVFGPRSAAEIYFLLGLERTRSMLAAFPQGELFDTGMTPRSVQVTVTSVGGQR